MKNILFCTLLLIQSISFAQVPAEERNALNALFNSTNGNNWYNSSNWNSDDPVSLFHGITVENRDGQDHVIEIDLYFNGLTGNLPIELQNLTYLTSLDVGRNNISGVIPDLTVIITLEYFEIRWNNFQFIDFENEYSTYISSISIFRYQQMNEIEEEIIYDIIIGNDYVMTMPTVEGTDVTYQWYKNDEPIIGETNLNFDIINAQIEDAANYTCKASSSIINDLTIDRETIHIYGTVSEIERDALIALYNATGGNNWNNNFNWNTSFPLYTWNGVNIEGTKVIVIDLSFNNLTGILPPEIGDLTNLETLSVWENNLGGHVPIALGNCNKLKWLFLDDNNFIGSIPIELSNLTLMEVFFMNGNQFTGELQDFYSNWSNLRFFSLGFHETETNYGVTGTIDLSNNTSITTCWVSHTSITTLNVRNGNNGNMRIKAGNNPNLNCVFVDDVDYSNENWINYIDETATFIETQEECDTLVINDELFKQNIEIFPNPTSNIIYVQISNNQQLDSVQIVSLLGEEIFFVTSKVLDVSELSSGMYFAIVKTNKAVSKIKFLKE